MAGVLAKIFSPNDGSRAAIEKRVVASTQQVEAAANRLKDTVRELLDENDKVTGRQHYELRIQKGR